MKTKAKKTNSKKSLIKKMISKISPTRLTIEQKEAKNRVKLGKAKKIKTNFYQIGGTIVRTIDGKAYTSPEEFFSDGGAKDGSNITVIYPAI